jgi:hypothetical protein
MGLDLRVPQPASNNAVDKFVKDLNIGTANQIPNAPGVSRTITGLVFMVIDIHLRVPHLTKKIVWFNDLENHFVLLAGFGGTIIRDDNVNREFDYLELG